MHGDQPLGYGGVISALSDLRRAVHPRRHRGGCLLFQGRLEGGPWLVISDWDAGILPLSRRRELEADGGDDRIEHQPLRRRRRKLAR